MRILRTASTGRLLAAIAGLIAVVAGGAAIAVAATGSGPVPKPKPLPEAVHQALAAPAPAGLSADVNFTNNLITSADFTGEQVDPLLQGASGRIWLSGDRLRLELQSTDGDAQVLVHDGSFWISDPASRTVYEGTLPAGGHGSAGSDQSTGRHVPGVSKIQSEIERLMAKVNLAGARTADPTDVGGRPAYSVSISPKHAGGQLGSLGLAWDALRGVPLRVAVYARGSSTPVLELKLSNISYGAVPAADFALSPPAGYKVVRLEAPASGTGAPGRAGVHGRSGVHGLAAVTAAVPFHLAAPDTVVGLPRQVVRLLDMGGTPAALLTYGQGLGGIVVIEQRAQAGRGGAGHGQDRLGGLSLPTVSIDGATGQELDTALGTVVSFTRAGVRYTVIGSVTPYAADQAARALVR